MGKCFTCDFCNKPLVKDPVKGTFNYSTVPPDGDRACEKCAEQLQKGTLQPKKKAPAPAETPVAAAPAGDEDYFGILTLAQLQDEKVWKPLGVKASTREKNLSDEEFKSCFEVDKAAFKALPKFKQEALKKKHKIF